MSDPTMFVRRFTQAVAQRNSPQTKQRAKPDADTTTIISNTKTKLSDEEYKKMIVSKMITHIHKHKEAIL
jgi:hypothetical protein